MEELKLQIIVLSEQVQNLSDKIDDNAYSLLAWSPALVGLITAVVALFVGLKSTTIAKQQIDASTKVAISQIKEAETREGKIFRANSRREWIENLRLNLAELFSLADNAHSCLMIKDIISAAQKTEKMQYHYNYIELMLNPNEGNHNDFILKLTELISATYSASNEPSKSNINDFVGKMGDARDFSKYILKLEWDKAKDLS